MTEGSVIRVEIHQESNSKMFTLVMDVLTDEAREEGLDN